MTDTIFQVNYCPECVGPMRMITITDEDKPIYQCDHCNNLWFIALVEIKKGDE